MEAVPVDNRAQALLVQRARQLVVPLGVHIDVTYRCDLDCVHCYLADRQRRELSLAEYETLFGELKALGTLHLLISGGEIFHRPDGLDIVRAARAHRFEVRLITHGGHIDEALAGELARLKIAVVAMSIYAADAAVHDAVTQVPGSWTRTVAAARHLVANGVTVQFKVVLTDANPVAVADLNALARSIGAGIEFHVDVKGDNDGSDRRMALNLTPEQKIAALGCVYPQLGSVTEDVFLDPSRHTCMAGNASCYISPDGTVQPCLDWDEDAGNLRDRSFREIWTESPVFLRARGIRRGSFEGCSSCSSFGSCGLCPARSLRETGSPTGSAPSKCRETLAKELASRAARRTQATP